MKKISINISDRMYFKIKKKSSIESEKQNKFVGMNDLIIPELEKLFGK